MGRKRDKGKQRKAKRSFSSIYTQVDGCEQNHGASNVPACVERFMTTFAHAFNKDIASRSIGYTAFIHAKNTHLDVWSNESHREVLRKVLVAQGIHNLLKEGLVGEFSAQEHAVGILIIEERNLRSVRDLCQGGKRELISFFHKRAECECLKGLWDEVKGQPKEGRCDGLCRKYIDRSALMLCECCRTEQYCSVVCQEHAWEEHKPVCGLDQTFSLYFDALPEDGAEDGWVGR